MDQNVICKMIKVLILKNWEFPPIFRQTPDGKGIWEGVQFTTDINSRYDYVLSLDSSAKSIRLHACKENIWKVNQEPPNEFFKLLHKGDKNFYRVFTTDPKLKGERYQKSQPAIPWFIEKSYDYLKNSPIPEKKFGISCIFSLKSSFIGHKTRLQLIHKLKNILPIDLISTFDYYFRQNPEIDFRKFESERFKLGFTKVVKNKWDALSSYRFSLIIENFSGPDYWSEKLSDCLLSWTIPIYYGCTNLDKYFPQGSYIYLDSGNNYSAENIKKLLSEDYWQKNLPALKKARNLILNKYQFFPYFSQFINEWENKYKNIKRNKNEIIIPAEDTPINRGKMGIKSRWEKIKNKFGFVS